MLQLSSFSIEEDHFVIHCYQNGQVKLRALSENALINIRINGAQIVDMNKINLMPNDRICIGTQFIFLFKNKIHE